MREPFVRLSVGNLDDANRSDVLVNGSLDGSSTVDLSVVERERVGQFLSLTYSGGPCDGPFLAERSAYVGATSVLLGRILCALKTASKGVQVGLFLLWNF